MKKKIKRPTYVIHDHEVKSTAGTDEGTPDGSTPVTEEDRDREQKAEAGRDAVNSEKYIHLGSGKKKLKVLKNKYNMEDTYEVLYKRSKHFSIEKMSTLFYPYLLANYDVKFSEKLKKLNTTVVCIIDMFSGRISVAKTPGHYFELEVEEQYMMPLKADRDQAIKDCPIEVSSFLMSSKKMPRIPDIIYRDEELIYRPFYIVECKNEDGENFHILFDTVTGDFSLLNA